MIKKFLYFLMILAAVTASTPVGAQDSELKEAAGKYAAGDFKSAATIYRQMLRAGRDSAALYYNLGNASLRAGFKGQAVLAYERALLRDPRDKDARWNLSILQSTLADRIEDADENVFISSIKKGLEYFSVDEAAALCSGLLGILALLAIAGFFVKGFRARTASVRGLLVFLTVIAGILFGLKWLEVRETRFVMLEKETVAYYGPSNKETKAFAIHEGTSGKILDSTDDWYYVALKNGSTGWIRKGSCELV